MMCVSRAHCNMTLFLRHVAVQTRDRQKGGVCYVPGSAAHHERARRRAQTAHAAPRPGHTTDSLILGRALMPEAKVSPHLDHANCSICYGGDSATSASGPVRMVAELIVAIIYKERPVGLNHVF